MARPSSWSKAGGENFAGVVAGSVRAPAFAGTFYPADHEACAQSAASYIQSRQSSSSEKPDAGDEFRERWLGGIVPHAGWVCSGAIAGEVIAALAEHVTPQVVVVFGAIHTPLDIDRAALASYARWQAPAGASTADADMTARLIGDRRWFKIDDRFHAGEHAVEVELPLIQVAWPDAQVLPVEVPVIESAVEIGTLVAQVIAGAGRSAVYLASSDLTHYGPAYRMTPAGVGIEALEWAKENDRRLLQIVTEMRAEQVVPEARSRLNACGGGAIAAMLAACQEAGATSAKVLRHANSYETLRDAGYAQPADNAVGYAGVIVGR